ncbi:MAG: hypothetical protein DRI34_06400 [Deltaproteobacteria bacterium]|nr:MAG: hypothetical protein DRI34_06400 [Deltaproteobacteria bacterium]
MRKHTSKILLLAGMLTACGGSGSFRLELTLPDATARKLTTQLRVAVVEPGAGATCEQLLSLAVRPGDEGYLVESEVSFAYPVQQEVLLDDVGPGQRLFYAEGQNRYGVVILNGCLSVQAGGPAVVSIALEWLGTCKHTNNGVEICDGVDNDCDDSTDEGDLEQLCPSPYGADAVACSEGACEFSCREGFHDVDQDWANGCECHVSRGGQEWCDGIDNDCDGVTDGASCINCSSDSDCVEQDGCLTGTCAGGECQSGNLPDGTSCDDGQACTEDDSCHAGVCFGTPKSCDDGLDCTGDSCQVDGSCSNQLLAGNCLIDGVCYLNGERSPDSFCRRCDTSNSTSSWTLEAEGTSCDDGLWCTGTDSCDAAGECQHANPPCAQACLGNCSEQTHECLPDDAGTACDDGFLCSDDDACDGQGNCIGTSSGGYCAIGQECLPWCADDASGCVAIPSWLELDCPEQAPLDQPASCSVTLHGSEGSEDCISCSVELVPSVLDHSDFFQPGGCDPGSWQFADSGCRSSGGAVCPYDAGDGSASCCAAAECDSNRQSFWFHSSTCGGLGFRLERLFDLRYFDSLVFCYRISMDNLDYDGGVEVIAEPGDGSSVVGIACDSPDAWGADIASVPCMDLPGILGTWESTRISFWSEVGQNSNIYLGATRLYAWPPECAQKTTVIDTEFVGCDGALEFDGWNFNGQPAVCLDGRSDCGLNGGLLIGSLDGRQQSDLVLYQPMNLVGLRPPARLCWTENFHYLDGSYRVALSSDSGGAWWVPIFEFSPPELVLQPTCRRICVDISDFSGIFGRDDVKLNIDGTAQAGAVLLNGITLEASSACDATGIFTIGPVEPDGGGGHRVEITNVLGEPRRALVECRWGSGQVSFSQEIEFHH